MFSAALRHQAQTRPEAPFLLFGVDVVSWGRAGDVVARTATLLEASGVRPGSRVMLAADNSPSFLYLWFALRWLGATCVPLHTQATGTAIGQMITDAGLSHVVGDNALLPRVIAVAPWLTDSAVTFADWRVLEDAVADLPSRQPEHTVSSAECNILYTSGTTGAPKGVVLSNEAFLSGGRELARALEVTAEDRILLGLPLFHTNPQVYAIMVALHTGCSVALLPRFVAAEFLDAAVRYEATGFTYVGTVLSLLATQPGPIPPHHLRFCVGGGAPEHIWNAVEDRLGVPVHELYGMTETGGWLTANRAGARRRGSCGTVRPDMQSAILDPNDEVLPAGEIGQIAVRPSRPNVVFDGYHARPELTLERWHNGWFHTGDLGEFDEDGYLYFRGRVDDVIRRGGENVSPSDIEAVLSEHPLIAEVVVVGVPDETMGQEVKAVIVPLPGFDPLSVLSHLKDRLPRFAWPRYVELREQLPKTPTQKIQARELRERRDDDIDLRAIPTSDQQQEMSR